MNMASHKIQSSSGMVCGSIQLISIFILVKHMLKACMQATPFFQPASNGSRRLLQMSEGGYTSSGQSKGVRRMLANSPGPSAATGDILDAVVQFTVRSASPPPLFLMQVPVLFQTCSFETQPVIWTMKGGDVYV